MIISKNGQAVEVPDTFLENSYIFGVARINAIQKSSGLTQEQFAKRYGFNYLEVTSWSKRREQGGSNPNPSARVDLVFIEQSLQK